MQLLNEIERTPGCRRDGRAVTRTAVRGIILDGRNLLLVYSPINGDYKFPGGGVDAGESHLEALAREIREECGAEMLGVLGEFGKMIEYDLPQEPDFDVFQMTSYYYLVEVGPQFGAQRLDDYEQDLGFRPVWVDIDQAVANNRAVYAENRPGRPKWIPRDLYVLSFLREHLANKS
jgi:8-oxo-dGTP diphosphatase